MTDKRKNNGGARKGAGRKAKENTVTTGFRVHEESLNIIRAENYPINKDVNSLIKRVAKKLNVKRNAEYD